MPSTNSDPKTHFAEFSDGQLLCQFIERGEQEAFAVLVQRHGPMVLGVCRRVLHHDHDTEDAFQAAFVVLARKARSISKHDSVASWLYKVAYRIALRQRSDSIRRSAREQHMPPRTTDSGLGEVVRRELRQVLDEEVHRLPEKYREPILLCYLQGQTNEEAAALLRCPTGTIKIRLLRGREMLRKRLVKRGVALSIGALLEQTLMGLAEAAVPPTLANAATGAALGAAAATVTDLSAAALKGMCLAKLKVAALVLLTVGLVSLADALLVRAAAAPATSVEQKLGPAELVPTSVADSIVASWRR